MIWVIGSRGPLDRVHPTLGFGERRGTTLQFMREQEDVWMEIPSPKDGGSYGKHIPITDVRAVIASLPQNLSPKDMDGFEFQAW